MFSSDWTAGHSDADVQNEEMQIQTIAIQATGCTDSTGVH